MLVHPCQPGFESFNRYDFDCCIVIKVLIDGESNSVKIFPDVRIIAFENIPNAMWIVPRLQVVCVPVSEERETLLEIEHKEVA